MHNFKNRQRVLLLGDQPSVSDNLSMILSSVDFLVDRATTFDEAILKFLDYRQSIIIADPRFLPYDPQTLSVFFNKAKKNPILLLTVTSVHDTTVQHYIKSGVDDIIHLPLDAEDVCRVVKRAVNYNRIQNEIRFFHDLFYFARLSLPVWVILLLIAL